jgi:hypothetical protein
MGVASIKRDNVQGQILASGPLSQGEGDSTATCSQVEDADQSCVAIPQAWIQLGGEALHPSEPTVDAVQIRQALRDCCR